MSPKPHSRIRTLLAGAVVSLVLPASLLAQQTPTARDLIRQACDAAGTLETYSRLGTLQLDLSREEVAVGGAVTRSRLTRFATTPGPVPGRFEIAEHKLVAGDDGSGGWALLDEQPDPRPQTVYMVKRQLQTDLFPLLLPFSLTWDGVGISAVTSHRFQDRDVWRLAVDFERAFFSSPQISLVWFVYVDKTTHQVMGAESVHTDLGHGLRADGMRFSWPKRTTLRGVTLPAEQRVVGVDEIGKEKAHTRTELLAWSLVPPARAATLFENPLPPDERTGHQRPPMVPGMPGGDPR